MVTDYINRCTHKHIHIHNKNSAKNVKLLIHSCTKMLVTIHISRALYIIFKYLMVSSYNEYVRVSEPLFHVYSSSSCDMYIYGHR